MNNDTPKTNAIDNANDDLDVTCARALTLARELERENAALLSELRQCRAMLNDDERTEEECIKILEPIVGYDREQPYVLRLSSAVRRLAQMVALPNVKTSDTAGT